MATQEKLKTPDPMIATPPDFESGMDYASHITTYNRFLNLTKWFTIHLVFIVVALYFFLFGENPTLGTILLFVGVATFAYGVLRNPKVKQDLQGALSGDPVAK